MSVSFHCPLGTNELVRNSDTSDMLSEQGSQSSCLCPPTLHNELLSFLRFSIPRDTSLLTGGSVFEPVCPQSPGWSPHRASTPALTWCVCTQTRPVSYLVGASFRRLLPERRWAFGPLFSRRCLQGSGIWQMTSTGPLKPLKPQKQIYHSLKYTTLTLRNKA